jgi:hypothetical protein
MTTQRERWMCLPELKPGSPYNDGQTLFSPTALPTNPYNKCGLCQVPNGRRRSFIVCVGTASRFGANNDQRMEIHKRHACLVTLSHIPISLKRIYSESDPACYYTKNAEKKVSTSLEYETNPRLISINRKNGEVHIFRYSGDNLVVLSGIKGKPELALVY